MIFPILISLNHIYVELIQKSFLFFNSFYFLFNFVFKIFDSEKRLISFQVY